MNAVLALSRTMPASIDAAMKQAAVERRAADLFRQGYRFDHDATNPGWYWCRRPESGNVPVKFYYLTLADTFLGQPICTCPAFEHGGGLVCKHVVALRMEVDHFNKLCAEHDCYAEDAETAHGCDWPVD